MKSIPVSKINAVIETLREHRTDKHIWEIIDMIEETKEESEEMIPVSKIDALIASLQSYSKFLHQHDIGSEAIKSQVQLIDLVVIPNLSGIKEKESEEMIPLSQLKQIIDDARYAEDIESDVCELVNNLKDKDTKE